MVSIGCGLVSRDCVLPPSKGQQPFLSKYHLPQIVYGQPIWFMQYSKTPLRRKSWTATYAISNKKESIFSSTSGNSFSKEQGSNQPLLNIDSDKGPKSDSTSTNSDARSDYQQPISLSGSLKLSIHELLIYVNDNLCRSYDFPPIGR